MPRSLHERLRHDSAPAHAALEDFIQSQHFFASRSRYVAFLHASLSFQTEAEQALADCDAQAVIPDWDRRRRKACLARRDLADLHVADTRSAPPLALTTARTPGWVLGTAYVVEGATLGGAVLLQAVEPLGVTPEHGASYLASYGPERGILWKGFLTTLARWERAGVDQEEVVNAAREAFAAARRHFVAVSDWPGQP